MANKRRDGRKPKRRRPKGQAFTHSAIRRCLDGLGIQWEHDAFKRFAELMEVAVRQAGKFVASATRDRKGKRATVDDVVNGLLLASPRSLTEQAIAEWAQKQKTAKRLMGDINLLSKIKGATGQLKGHRLHPDDEIAELKQLWKEENFEELESRIQLAKLVDAEDEQWIPDLPGIGLRTRQRKGI